MAEASVFKFGKLLGFADTHNKITPKKKKWAWPWVIRKLPNIWGFRLLFLQRVKIAISILICSLSLPRSVIKHTHRNKCMAWQSGYTVNGFELENCSYNSKYKYLKKTAVYTSVNGDSRVTHRIRIQQKS